MAKAIGRLLTVIALASALGGCVVYPAGYYRPAYVYRPVAVAAPCCGYGYGWHRW
jgi:hypothetical protein